MTLTAGRVKKIRLREGPPQTEDEVEAAEHTSVSEVCQYIFGLTCRDSYHAKLSAVMTDRKASCRVTNFVRGTLRASGPFGTLP
jgi:hypothetical protein